MKTFARQRWSVSSAIIILISLINLFQNKVSAEICTVCSNATHVMNDETARVVWPPGNTDGTGLECSDIADKAVNGYFSNCTVLHSYSDLICQCGPEEEPFTCSLCGDGVELPEPGRMVAGKTCAEWQDFATLLAPAMDCPYYQTSIAAYCGCDSSQPNFFEGFCKLCDDKILPNYNKKVAFVDGSQKYCVNVELEVNIYSNNYDCAYQQDKFKTACACSSDGPELPTLSPTNDLSPAADNTLHVSFLFKILPIASVLLLVN